MLAFFLILISLYDLKLSVYSLMVFFVLFDMIDGFYKDLKVFAAVRYIIPIFLILFFVVKNSALKKSDFIFLLLSIYLLILFVYSHGEIFITSRRLFAILITLSMIPIGRYIGWRVDFLQEFEIFKLWF